MDSMAFNSIKNYYEILGVGVDADLAQIKSAYRKLARKYHPDINKAPEAVDIFKEITQAYETLSNDKDRENYNILNGIFSKLKVSRKELIVTLSGKTGIFKAFFGYCSFNLIARSLKN